MSALRTGPWRDALPWMINGMRATKRQRMSLHESSGCGITLELEYVAATQFNTTHPCRNPPYWIWLAAQQRGRIDLDVTLPDTTAAPLPCCEFHISAWIELVGVAGAIKHRVLNPLTHKHVPALFLPTRIEHYPSGGRKVFYQHTAKGPATSVIDLTSEEAQATADEIESLGVHDGIDLAKDHWLRSRLRVLVAELDPQRDAIATYWLTAAAGNSYTVQMHVFCDRGVWRPRPGEHQTADFHNKMRDYSPHEVDHRAHRIELEDGTILKSRSGQTGANRP